MPPTISINGGGTPPLLDQNRPHPHHAIRRVESMNPQFVICFTPPHGAHRFAAARASRDFQEKPQTERETSAVRFVKEGRHPAALDIMTAAGCRRSLIKGRRTPAPLKAESPLRLSPACYRSLHRFTRGIGGVNAADGDGETMIQSSTPPHRQRSTKRFSSFGFRHPHCSTPSAGCSSPARTAVSPVRSYPWLSYHSSVSS